MNSKINFTKQNRSVRSRKSFRYIKKGYSLAQIAVFDVHKYIISFFILSSLKNNSHNFHSSFMHICYQSQPAIQWVFRHVDLSFGWVSKFYISPSLCHVSIGRGLGDSSFRHLVFDHSNDCV